VRLIAFDPQAEDKVLAAILFGHSDASFGELLERVRALGPDERLGLLEGYLTRRRHRRDKPGRALENAVYTFEIVCNIGAYRDLHRHRLLTQERQAFTVALGYDRPPEIEEMGQAARFTAALERAARLYEQLAPEFPLEAQYVVPFAYRVRWYITVNLRELYHLVELRTMPQGHPDYRATAQDLWQAVREVHPRLAFYAKFADMNAYRLGRLQSELRTEYKKSQI
jgi:thymidylate synthase ThyX